MAAGREAYKKKPEAPVAEKPVISAEGRDYYKQLISAFPYKPQNEKELDAAILTLYRVDWEKENRDTWQTHQTAKHFEDAKELITSQKHLERLAEVIQSCWKEKIDAKYVVENGLVLVKDRVRTPEDITAYCTAFINVAKSFEAHGLHSGALFLNEGGFHLVNDLILSPDDVTKYGGKFLDYTLACTKLKFLGHPIHEYAALEVTLVDAKNFILSEAHLDRLLAFSLTCIEKEIRPHSIFKDGFSAAAAAIKTPEDITEAGKTFLEFFEGCARIAQEQDTRIDPEYVLKRFSKAKEVIVSQEHLKMIAEAELSSIENNEFSEPLFKYLCTIKRLVATPEGMDNCLKTIEAIAKSYKAEGGASWHLYYYLKAADALVSSPKDITEYGKRFLRVAGECGEGTRYVAEYCLPAVSKFITSKESLAKCDQLVIGLARSYKEEKVDPEYVFKYGFSMAKSYISSLEDAASYGSKFVELCKYDGGNTLMGLPSEDWLISRKERFDTVIDAAIALAKCGVRPRYVLTLYLSEAKPLIASEEHFNALLAACVSAAERRTAFGRIEPEFMLKGFLVFKEYIKTPKDIAEWGRAFADLAEACKLAECTEEEKDIYTELVFKKGLEAIKDLIKSPEDVPKSGDMLIRLAVTCHKRGLKSDPVFSEGLPAAKELFTSEERFNRIMEACISLADNGIKSEPLLKSALPALRELIDSKERFGKFIEFTTSLEPSLAEHYLRAFENRAGSDIEVLTSDALKGYISAVGGNAYQFLGVLHGTPVSSLSFILDQWKRFPDAMARVIDRSPELLVYHRALAGVGYDASEETAFLIKKGNKAEITRLALNLMAVYAMKEEYPADLEYLVKLRKDFKPVERIAALDTMVSFTRIARDLPNEARDKLADARSKLFSFAPSVSEEKLHEAYPDVMEYLGRHAAISRDEVLPLLSACLSLGKALNLGTVNIEKQQLKMGAKVEIKEKYEKKFLSELQVAEKRARYESFMERTDIHHAILELVCGGEVERKGELPADFKIALEGYFNVQHNRELLGELLRTYYLKGPEEAERWVSGLEGNRKVIKLMESRGTDLDAISKYKASYEAQTQDFQEKYEIRASQVYGELHSLLHQLGYKEMKDLGVEETDDRLATGMALAKVLNQLLREGNFSSDQKLIVDDVNGHVENLKSALGQLHTVKEGGKVTFFVATDPIKKLRMGVGFPSCLDVTKKSNGHGAVARTIDANNVTLYAADGNEDGPIIGRVSLMESDKGFFVNSTFYENTTYDLFAPQGGWVDALVKLANATGRDVIIVPNLFSRPIPTLAKSLETAGFALGKVELHVDKAVCDNLYSDLGFGEYTPEEGMRLSLEAYVLKAKPNP